MLGIALLLLTQAPRVLVVGAGNHATITSAIAAARAGDTVVVRAGEYREPTLVIDRSIILSAEPGVVLDGEGARGLMVVRAPGVTIRGFTFRHTGSSYREDRAALLLDGAVDCVVADNRFDETFFGIYLARTDGCHVSRNVIHGVATSEAATGNAIHSWGSRNVHLTDNRMSGHRDGLYLEFTRHATVTGNWSAHNLRYGLHFMYADSSNYAGNRFLANGSGVAVMYSRVVTMTRNVFRDNNGPTAHGLLLKEISDVRLEGNRFEHNATGLLADGANRLAATGNQFVRNGWAVRLLASTDGGRFTGNSFEGNSFDVVVNGRNTTATFDSNWWDAYRGWDLDADGVGDTPHFPVRLFALLVERAPAAVLLQRSLFVRVLDAAERTIPVLTPRGVVDATPLANRPPWGEQ